LQPPREDINPLKLPWADHDPRGKKASIICNDHLIEEQKTPVKNLLTIVDISEKAKSTKQINAAGNSQRTLYQLIENSMFPATEA
jgi:hypothetical protein